jgi:hypothetical protein
VARRTKPLAWERQIILKPVQAMPTEKNSDSSHYPEQVLTDLDHALNYIAAAVANLHEAALHLKNCDANRLTETIEQAREEIRKSWRGVQEIRHNQGPWPGRGDTAVQGDCSVKESTGG